MTISNVSHKDRNIVCVKYNCGFFIQHNTPCRHLYYLFRKAPHVSHFPSQCLHAWALTYGEPGKEDATLVLHRNHVDFEVHGGVLFLRGDPGTSYVDLQMTSTDKARFQLYFEKVVDINMKSMGHSQTQAVMNNTLLTRPTRKKKKAARMRTMRIMRHMNN